MTRTRSSNIQQHPVPGWHIKRKISFPPPLHLRLSPFPRHLPEVIRICQFRATVYIAVCQDPPSASHLNTFFFKVSVLFSLLHRSVCVVLNSFSAFHLSLSAVPRTRISRIVRSVLIRWGFFFPTNSSFRLAFISDRRHKARALGLASDHLDISTKVGQQFGVWAFEFCSV